MCFRPADASAGPNKCPHCGKAIQAMGGMVLKNCPFCKGDLTAAAPGAPAAPVLRLLLVPPRLPVPPRLLACKKPLVPQRNSCSTIFQRLVQKASGPVFFIP